MRRARLAALMVGIAAALVGVEALARFGLGLGTSPLYQPDPLLEYRLVPGQHIHCVGNLFTTNERGMRSPPLHGETRDIVLVAGDSVVNGGLRTDQAVLATTFLTDHRRLFANLSAASWGPANEHAALVQSEDLEPLARIVVLNSADLTDLPDFGSLDARTHPQERPLLATAQVVSRYLPRYLPPALTGRAQTAPGQAPSPAVMAAGRDELERLLSYLSRWPGRSCIVLHPSRDALRQGRSPAYREIARRAAAHGLAVEDPFDRLRAAVAAGSPLYRDTLHFNAAGQRELARSIAGCLGQIGLADTAGATFAPPVQP